MLCGCIDIGTNTTRVLVAEARDGRLTRCCNGVRSPAWAAGWRRAGGSRRRASPKTPGWSPSNCAMAEQAGARTIRTVATAVIRSAINRDEFCQAMREHGGVDVCVLDGEEEARLAFLGATRTLGAPLDGRVGVVDVGGGSTEIAIGTVDGGVEWWRSFAFGSGFLADAYLGGDPPSLDAARRRPLPRRAGAQARLPAAG